MLTFARTLRLNCHRGAAYTRCFQLRGNGGFGGILKHFRLFVISYCVKMAMLSSSVTYIKISRLLLLLRLPRETIVVSGMKIGAIAARDERMAEVDVPSVRPVGLDGSSVIVPVRRAQVATMSRLHRTHERSLEND